jgi:hypothetical protein
MGSYALVNASIYLGGVDLSTDHNQVMVDAEAEELDATTFQSGGWRTSKKGLRKATITGGGFINSPSGSDPNLWNNLLSGTDLISTVAQDYAVASVAYFGRMIQSKLSLFGEVGQLAPFNWNATSRGLEGLVRGQVLWPATATVTSSSSGSGYQLGAVSASQKLYAAVHVFTATGTTLDVTIESDNAASFASPTTQITFTQIATTATAQFSSAAGAITDDWFRPKFVVTGAGPYALAIVAGVQ